MLEGDSFGGLNGRFAADHLRRGQTRRGLDCHRESCPQLVVVGAARHSCEGRRGHGGVGVRAQRRGATSLQGQALDPWAGLHPRAGRRQPTWGRRSKPALHRYRDPGRGGASGRVGLLAAAAKRGALQARGHDEFDESDGHRRRTNRARSNSERHRGERPRSTHTPGAARGTG